MITLKRGSLKSVWEEYDCLRKIDKGNTLQNTTEFGRKQTFNWSNEIEYIYGGNNRKITLMIFERHANLKYKYGNRKFWCRGYYVSTVGRNKKAIEQYVRNQENEDMMSDQMSIKEMEDPFKG